MKLETIKAAISEWYDLNDFVDETQTLLNQGVIFKIDPKVKDVILGTTENLDVYIHAYPAIVEGKLKFILINSEMDKLEKFEDEKNPITRYIYIADVMGMDSQLAAEFLKLKSLGAAEDKISPEEAKERILRWSLIKDEWIVNQINNTEGVFEVFVIPDIDLKKDSDIYAFLALTDKNTADLIIMDKNKQTNELKVINPDDEGLYDVVVPCPPFGDGDDVTSSTKVTNGKTDRQNFFLLNYCTEQLNRLN